MWITLLFIVILIMCSIYGAFIGAEKAGIFFNSIPLAIYWIALFTLLLEGIASFRRLLRVPALLFIHAGCVAILIGGLWGSVSGRELQKQWLGRDIIPEGSMVLMNGEVDNHVYIGNKGYNVRELPFSLALDRFYIEHYPGKMNVRDIQNKKSWNFTAEPDAEYDLGPPHGKVHITGVYENFKISIEKDAEGRRQTRAYDDTGHGSNPALAVQLENESGPRYVFEGHSGHAADGNSLIFQYRKGMISEYTSEVKVFEESKKVAQKDIEVNHPLYYGGYHFYQSSYGEDSRTGEMYTVLSVVPDTGLYCVYLGYLLLCAGVSWQCWFLSIPRILKQEAGYGN
jgi:hypothetical protein